MTSFYKSKSLLLFLGFTLFLSSCGQDVCVAGIGKCEVPKEIRGKQTTSPNPAGTAFGTVKAAIITDTMNIGFQDTLKLTGIGGKPPYKYSLSSGFDTGKVTEDTGEFTPPPEGNPKIATVKITDSNGRSVEIKIDIR